LFLALRKSLSRKSSPGLRLFHVLAVPVREHRVCTESKKAEKNPRLVLPGLDFIPTNFHRQGVALMRPLLIATLSERIGIAGSRCPKFVGQRWSEVMPRLHLLKSSPSDSLPLAWRCWPRCQVQVERKSRQRNPGKGCKDKFHDTTRFWATQSCACARPPRSPLFTAALDRRPRASKNSVSHTARSAVRRCSAFRKVSAKSSAG
jgi:hypothetical protein